LGQFDAHVTRVFGAGPFCEVGKPRVFTSDTRGLLTIGGDFDVPSMGRVGIAAGLTGGVHLIA
jgi:hypothetical protein